MRKDKTATSLGIAAVIVIALILIVGFGVYLNAALSAESAGQTFVSFTSTTKDTTVSSFTKIEGLQFNVLINSSTTLPDQNLSVTLSLFNTLGSRNNITGEQDWKLTSQSEGICAQNDIFRIEVLKGYYGLSNYSSGAALDVFPFLSSLLGLNQCLLYVRAVAQPFDVPWAGQNYYIFNPKSDVAQWVTTGVYTTCSDSCTKIANGTLVGECSPCNAINQTADMNETMILKPALFSNSTGVFTIVGGDEWGDLQIIHFIEQPSQNQTAATSITSGETCTPMNTGNQTTATETYLCHIASTRASNSSSSG